MDELENELAEAIFKVLTKNNVKTGYHENGNGQYLDVKIDFKYLYNQGDAKLIDLDVSNKISEHNKI